MKVLLLPHFSFVSGESEKAFLEELCKQADTLGHQFVIFDLEKHKLSDFHLIHFFGFGHFELARNLKKMGHTIICTPPIHTKPNRTNLSFLAEKILVLFHAIKQRKISPQDRFGAIRDFDQYVLNVDQEEWEKSWSLPRERTIKIPLHSSNLAIDLLKIYNNLAARDK